MIRIRRVLVGLVVCFLMFILCGAFATLLVGDIALISGKNELGFNTQLVVLIGSILFVIGLVLYLTGKMSLSNIEGIKCCRVLSIIVFGGMIVSSLIYMYLVGEVKYVMLFLMVGLWVLLFTFLYIFSKIEKNLAGEGSK